MCTLFHGVLRGELACVSWYCDSARGCLFNIYVPVQTGVKFGNVYSVYKFSILNCALPLTKLFPAPQHSREKAVSNHLVSARALGITHIVSLGLLISSILALHINPSTFL